MILRQEILDVYNALVITPEDYLASLNLTEVQLAYFKSRHKTLRDMYLGAKNAIFPNVEDTPVMIHELLINFQRSTNEKALVSAASLLFILSLAHAGLEQQLQYARTLDTVTGGEVNV